MTRRLAQARLEMIDGPIRPNMLEQEYMFKRIYKLTGSVDATAEEAAWIHKWNVDDYE